MLIYVLRFQASGHRYVAVGYTDGMVAIFDLETTSDLLKLTKNNGVDVLFPYKIIKAHMHYISGEYIFKKYSNNNLSN